MYISKKYEDFQTKLLEVTIQGKKIETLSMEGLPFSFVAIHKNGFSVYLGYELSAITALKKRIIRIFFASIPFVVLASVLFVYFVTQRLMKTVNAITQESERKNSYTPRNG